METFKRWIFPELENGKSRRITLVKFDNTECEWDTATTTVWTPVTNISPRFCEGR